MKKTNKEEVPEPKEIFYESELVNKLFFWESPGDLGESGYKEVLLNPIMVDTIVNEMNERGIVVPKKLIYEQMKTVKNKRPLDKNRILELVNEFNTGSSTHIYITLLDMIDYPKPWPKSYEIEHIDYIDGNLELTFASKSEEDRVDSNNVTGYRIQPFRHKESRFITSEPKKSTRNSVRAGGFISTEQLRTPNLKSKK